MNHPHTPKTTSGSLLTLSRNSANSPRHSEEKETVSHEGGGGSRGYHEHSASRLRQRRVCLPGFWVAHP